MTEKNNTMAIILRMLELGMQSLSFFIVLLMLSYNLIKLNISSVAESFLLAVLPVVLVYMVRARVRSNILIVIIHAGVAVFFMIYGKTPDERLVYLLFGVALLLFSLSLCKSQKEKGAEKIPIGFASLFVCAVWISNVTGLEQMAKAGMYGGGIFIILHILYLNFDNMNRYMIMNREIAGLPVKQMVVVNVLQMSVLVTLFAAVIFVIGNTYVSRMVEIIGGLFLTGLKAILRFIFSIGKDLESGYYIPKTEPGEGGEAILHALMEESIWTEILNGIGMIFGSILGVTCLIGLCIGIVLVIIKSLKNMSPDAENDVKEFVVPRDITEFRWRKKERRKDVIGTGNNGKLRRLYKSQVEKAVKQKGDTISAMMMPYEISKQHMQDVAELATRLYEKARYSDLSVTKEEIVDLKKRLK